MITGTLRQWWTRTSEQQLFAAQEKLLTSFVRAVPRVSLSSSAKNRRHGLNVVEFLPSPAATKPSSSSMKHPLATVILLHGYGSGLGFFFRNIDPLIDSGKVGRVLLVDWLGMGGSDRPYCRRPIRGLSDCTTSWCQSRFNPSQAIDFFLDPLDHLLKELIEEEEEPPIWMMGHSLGGYLVARYALDPTYGASLHSNNNMHNKIILVSPVGFPDKPTNLLPSAQLPTAIRLLDALWSANITPQQLIRIMGATRGRKAVHRALAGRIPHLVGTTTSNNNDDDDDTLEILANYLFHITAAHPSGEFAINSLLEPGISPDMAGVFAREPLEPLFQEYAQRFLKPYDEQHQQTTTMPQWKVLFGDKDWMRPNEPSARQALGYLTQQKGSAASRDRASVHIVPNAGHHVYLDNPESFVHHIVQ
jgi:cardiolipin-specific phospholipase